MKNPSRIIQRIFIVTDKCSSGLSLELDEKPKKQAGALLPLVFLVFYKCTVKIMTWMEESHIRFRHMPILHFLEAEE